MAIKAATANLRHKNVIDRCWRDQSNWDIDRQRLVVCSVGLARKMQQNRGRGVTAYTVTDPSDDPVRPKPGTLRSKVWIDHNTLARCEDGLLDVTLGSTDVTVSNNWFHDHDKVMLLGHNDQHVADRRMRVTVAFNRFGPNVTRRTPVGHAAGKDWHCHSSGDSFENGAVFKQTGSRVRPNYNRHQAFSAVSAGEVRSLTKDAGALRCFPGAAC
uniref:Pectate lyase domain-containing protein n=1 Tax=Aegilops tauschii TaxID=37682 RepID=M8B340_AEGTA